MFAAAVKERQSQLAKSDTVDAPDTHDNTSCDLFDDDDEIVPETQEAQTQIDSEDSGESVRIPFYDKKNTCFSESPSKPSNDSDDESEYMQVRPESHVIEGVADEPQSQMLMANIDRNLIRDLGMSALTQQTNNDQVSSDDSDDSTLTENDLVKGNARKNVNSEKPCDDRSESTTPDLDFLIDPAQGNKETDPAPRIDSSGENEQNSESIFDKCTQQFCNVESTSTDDIFAIPTQPVAVFKRPTVACSTPIAKTKTKSKSTTLDESIFEAETQLIRDEQNDDDDIFNIATQMAPSQKPASSKQSNTAHQDEQQDHETFGKFQLF